jgi:hypothetical protein
MTEVFHVERPGWFSTEASAALLHYIFPEYPGLRGHQPAPDPNQFLEEYRASKQSE